MRIIAGDLKGREIRLPKHSRARPITQFVLEKAMNLFSSYGCELGERLPAGTFLDICAGSGLIGFEALSRGAQRVIFVETDVDTVHNLRANAERCGIGPRVRVLKMDARKCAATAAKSLAEGELVSAVFLDPPFIAGMAADILSHFARGLSALGPGVLLHPQALLIIRAEDAVPTELPGLRFLEKRRSGRAALYLFAPEGTDWGGDEDEDAMEEE